jgi:hypothetical protein
LRQQEVTPGQAQRATSYTIGPCQAGITFAGDAPHARPKA